MPIKNLDIVKAWLDGKEVEYHDGMVWRKLTSADQRDSMPNFDGWKYRIKPEVCKTVGYRRAIYISPSNGKAFVSILYMGGILPDTWARNQSAKFIKWIDNDWIMEEFEKCA